MEHLIKSVETSLRHKNYISALYLTLTLPDICARLDSDDGETSKDKYIKWFNKYLADTYKIKIGADNKEHIFLTGNDLYALRCSILHEGRLDISSQRAQKIHSRFFFTSNHPHLRQINSVLQLDISSFCNEVINAVSKWLNNFKLSDKEPLLKDIVSIFTGNSFSTNDI